RSDRRPKTVSTVPAAGTARRSGQKLGQHTHTIVIQLGTVDSIGQRAREDLRVDSRRDGAALPVERAHFVVVNQALGPFYRRVVAGLSQRGHRVTVLSGENIDFSEPAVTVIAGPPADRSTIWTRARSWASFLRFAFLNVQKHHDKAVVLSSSNPPLLPHVCAYVGTHHTRHVA